ncbi:MAG: hypothetical protein HY952_06595 [Elusimicrobia bacterium]|nr:hypothetical protein [Elusimicrobiota bacterium]
MGKYKILLMTLCLWLQCAGGVLAQGDAAKLFSFEIEDLKGPVPPRVTFKVKVSLKGDFSGMAKFYSCDKTKFMLVDIGNAEFVENISYKIYARKGQITKFDAMFYGMTGGSVPLVCGEYSAGTVQENNRFYANRANEIIFRPDNDQDWYGSNIMEALELSDPFAVARTHKLLTNYFPESMAKGVIPGLVAWAVEGRSTERVQQVLGELIKKYGGREVAAEAVKLLKSEDWNARKTGLVLLDYCGPDADIARDTVEEMLAFEKDPDLVRIALLLAANRGYVIPPKYSKPEEIPDANVATHKKEIEEVCDRAAGVDLGQKEEYPRYYDDTGVRIPAPPAAKKAISDLESLIGRMPNYPEMARVYLLLGRLMQRFENRYARTYDPETYASGMPSEVQARSEQYSSGEPAAEYYYNGYHFDQLLKIFPHSEFADDAAFEKTAVLHGGECEGDENCSLDWGVWPYIGFLTGYPRSDLAPKAIDAINKDFEALPVDKTGRISGSRYFSIQGLKNTLGAYEVAVSSAAPEAKAKAEDVLCSLWEKTGEKGHAVAACQAVLKEYPAYPAAADIKKRIEKLEVEDFELKSRVSGEDNRPALSWALIEGVGQYVVYRSSDGGGSFVKLAKVSGGNSYQDNALFPGTTYTYYVEAGWRDGVVYSRNVTALIPDDGVVRQLMAGGVEIGRGGAGALWDLGREGRDKVALRLYHYLAEGDPELQDGARNAIRSMGSHGSALLPLMLDKFRKNGTDLDLIASMGPGALSAVPELVRMLKESPSPELVAALERIGGYDSIGPLADYHLARMNAEIKKLDAGNVDLRKPGSLPQGCIMRELAPERLMTALGKLRIDGVSFEISTSPVSGRTGMSFDAARVSELIGKKVYLERGACLVLSNCFVKKPVADEIRRRLGRDLRPIFAQEGCQPRVAYPDVVKGIVPEQAGYLGLELQWGASRTGCRMTAGCKLFMKAEFEKLFGIVMDDYAPAEVFSIEPCRLDSDYQ